jgi:hypothetical protein
MSADIVTAPGTQAQKRDLHFEILSGMFAAGLLPCFFWACWYYAKASSGWGWLYVAAILGLPLLEVPLVILMLKRDSEFGRNGVLVLAPTLALEVALWWAFNLREKLKELLPYAASFGLVWALVLGIIIFYVTARIMGLTEKKGERFKKVLQKHPFLVVCFFLTIFTFIALFLSLSLALHDQDLRLNHKSLGLFAREVGFPDGGQDGDDEVLPTSPFTVLFRRGSAAVESISPPEPASKEGEDGEQPNDPEDRRKLHNGKHLQRLTNAILGAAEKDHVRVVLAGHSDDLPIDVKSTTYKSNFELSESRIHNVIVGVLDQLTQKPQREWRRNIEWLALPCASEQGFLRQGERKSGESLSVEVILLPSDGDRFSNANQLGGRRLDLQDYLYFGIYTITTTGFGDIIPVSAYAKFITTVANFFAIFLLAVFFNVLLSFLHGGTASGPKRQEPAGA